jgi:hypothetical protein
VRKKDEDRDALLEKNADQVTPEFLQIYLISLLNRRVKASINLLRW